MRIHHEPPDLDVGVRNTTNYKQIIYCYWEYLLYTPNCVKFSNRISLLHPLKDILISKTATQPTGLRDKVFVQRWQDQKP